MINFKEIKSKIIIKNNVYCLCIISIIFFLDRYTKLLILNNFTENTYYLNDYINLDLVWNIGIGFGLFSTNSYLFYNLVTLLIGLVIIIIFYVFINSNNFDKFVYSLIIGGALGNFYDRITYKAVPDFIDFHVGDFHWFIFNVADIFISLGVILMILIELFDKGNNNVNNQKN